MKKIFTLIFTFIAFTLCQAQTVDLSLKLEKGKEYKQVMTSRMTMVQKIEGEKIDIIATINGTMVFGVRDINEDGYLMEARYESLGMIMKILDDIISFSSEIDDPDDIFSRVFRAMKYTSFEVVMSKTGKIIEVRNLEAAWESVINQFEQLSEEEKEQIKTQIVQAYGDDAMKGNIEMVTAFYPDKPVNKGDKWTIETKLESGMDAKMTTKYKFVKLTPDYALIKGTSKIKTDDLDAYVTSDETTIKYDLTGTMKSAIKVDRNTGWIIEAEVYQKIKGYAYMKDNSQLSDELKIPIIMINEMLISDK